MKQKKLLTLLMLLLMVVTASAQRTIDRLDRGLVAVKLGSGVYVNWRIQSDEYYDVTYNLYRDGAKIASDLKVSNFTDTKGTTTSSYTVAPVVRGKEQAQSKAVKPWATDYLEINPQHDPSLKCVYTPNDACCADVDGDGVVEILLKYDNASEIGQSYPREGALIDGKRTKEYTLLECLKLDGTVLWWVNCGPNMGDFQNNEINIVGYDWDMDGKAEALFRAADGTTIHTANGETYVIGDASINYRGETGGGVNWFMHAGMEYLVYVDGATGVPYNIGPSSHPTYMDFPLPRLEATENPNGLLSGDAYDDLVNKAWGDGYGHRSSKYFFGAPYLDGRHPSIFLGRGIYTRHKFITYDVDPTTHKLVQRWKWTNNSGGPWKGQGYHNYAIVDVDWDGRDEIVWGSMVIDDNGKGLSTTGLGHGDAQHHGDFDPYTWGQEGFFCNEEQPNNNMRDLTTSKIYYRTTPAQFKDDGRSICGNFSNDYPGCFASSGSDAAQAISTVAHERVNAGTGGMAQNFRCYWDGDLCEETFNYINGKNTAGAINKYGMGVIKTLTGSMTNNDTKGTPCYMGDILGDWREEFIMRTADNKIRVYTSTYPTSWRNYSLWYDHQYRNGMVWEMCGYNQPPHVSYFLGELEGITAAPPSFTMEGRTEVANGGTISQTEGDVITCETNDMTVSVADGATPYIYIDNAPSHVEGAAPSEATGSSYKIKYNYFTHTLTGGAFAGDMRLVKQGDGKLILPNVEQKYTGNTDVWAGTLQFDGTLNSALWLNRFAQLNSDGGKFNKGLKADYAAVIRPGGEDNTKASSITTTDLVLGFGSIVELDIFSDGLAADKLNAATLTIEKKVWPNGGGPAYDCPVFRITAHKVADAKTIADGKYLLGEVGEIKGDLSNILIENMTYQKTELIHEDGKLYLNVKNYDGTPLTWKGDKSSIWNLDADENFIDNTTNTAAKFVTGSRVTFDDSAQRNNVTVVGNVVPSSIYFNNSSDIRIIGDSIVGDPEVVKENNGAVYLNSQNHFASTTINGGTIYASSLANDIGEECGSLGKASNTITVAHGGALGVESDITSTQRIICGADGGAITVGSNKTFRQKGTISTTNSSALTKKGGGTLIASGTISTSAINVAGGSMYHDGPDYAKNVTLSNTVTIGGNGFVPSNVIVEKGANATLTLTGTYYKAYSGKLSGAGTLTINPTNTVNRVSITGDWSQFTGTVKYANKSILMPLKNSKGIPNGTLDVADGCYVSNVAMAYPIGKLTGKGVLEHPVCDFSSSAAVSGSNTWKVGNSSEDLGDFTFAGIFTDGGGTNKCNFEKVGSCVMTVSGAWTNSGTVKVSDGTLKLSTSSLLGTGALTVAAGATLSGSMGSSVALKNTTTTINGTLAPGLSPVLATGSLIFDNKPVNITNTGTLRIGVQRSSTSDTQLSGTGIKGISRLTLNGKISLYFYNYTPEVGDVIRLWTGVTTFVGTPTVECDEAGVEFDDSRISEGVLIVKSVNPTSIKSLAADEEVEVTVFDLGGVEQCSYITTASAIERVLGRQGLVRGNYVLRIKSAKGTFSEKKAVR